MDKFQEAICAFANDLPNSRKNGYLILGAYDDGSLSGLKVTDDLLKKIAMKTLGYVNMFNRGIGQVQTDLKENGNKPAEFDVTMLTAFLVTVEQKDIEQFKFVPSDVKPTVSSEGDITSLSPALSPVLSPVCPQLSEGQLEKIEVVIDYLLNASGSITELMDCAGEKNKNRFRQTILKPLVDTGLVEPTIKDVPNSPKQKYALTPKGRELISIHTKG